MRVFLSTVVRGAPAELGGELIAVDWNSRQILKRLPVFPSHPEVADPNSRGNARGGRGIALLPEELFVANYHSLVGFDFNLQPTRTLSSFQFGGLHELKVVPEGIWVSATSLGAVHLMDLQGKLLKSWWAHEDPLVREKFDPTEFVVDKTRDNRLAYLKSLSKVHLNNVEVFDGRVYVTLNNHGAVLRLFPTEIVAHDPALKGCHNGLVTPRGELLVNDSHHHTVVVFDLQEGHVLRKINLLDFPEVARINAAPAAYRHISLRVRLMNWLKRKRVARPLFTRGMCLLDDSRVLIGISPATVLEVDFRSGRLLDYFQLSHYVNECIHGLEAAPSLDFPRGIPPANTSS
jgi:hypothetical protein